MSERRPTPHGETPYSPTSLLRALTANPLDVDALRGTDGVHEEAAPPDTRGMRVLTALAAIVLGFVVAVSVSDLRSEAAAEDSPRDLLEQEVRETRAEARDLEAEQQALQDDIAAAQGDVLAGTDQQASDRLAAYERAGAGVAMTGPGVVLVLDDSAELAGGAGVSEGTVNRVTDEDVQIAVNGLWDAGAEAVAVNGQRISATSAIRTAGSAVLVDFRPLSPPYRITALGDPETLRSGVEEGPTGEYLSEISSRFAIRTAWESAPELTVPARTLSTLREASALDPARGPVPSTPADPAPADDGGSRKESS